MLPLLVRQNASTTYGVKSKRLKLCAIVDGAKQVAMPIIIIATSKRSILSICQNAKADPSKKYAAHLAICGRLLE